MHWKVRRDFLSRVEIFSTLTMRDLKSVAKSCSESMYNDEDFLCHQGERGVAAFLIVSGKIDVLSEMDNGSVVTLAQLGQGSIVGELSIIDGANRVASIKAVGEVLTLVLTQWDMHGLIKNRPSIAASMLPVIVKRFRETTKELRNQNSKSENTRNSIVH